MDRLTKRTDNGIAYLSKVKSNEQEIEGSKNTLECLYDSWQKLADYEDLEEKAERAKKPLTNFDKVIEMTIKQMADFINSFTNKNDGEYPICEDCIGCDECSIKKCMEVPLNWLESEITDG